VTPVLLDTGVIVALLDQSEKFHAQCVEVVAALEQPLVTCEAVIVESCYLLRRVRGAPEFVLANVENGAFQLPLKLSDSIGAIKALMHKYRDLPADLADACLIHMADLLDTPDVLTLDKHFRAYRWRRNRSFEMLIQL
jgi:uncharacterized protein